MWNRGTGLVWNRGTGLVWNRGTGLVYHFLEQKVVHQPRPSVPHQPRPSVPHLRGVKKRKVQLNLTGKVTQWHSVVSSCRVCTQKDDFDGSLA